jgi:hypothetical protein
MILHLQRFPSTCIDAVLSETDGVEALPTLSSHDVSIARTFASFSHERVASDVACSVFIQTLTPIDLKLCRCCSRSPRHCHYFTNVSICRCCFARCPHPLFHHLSVPNPSNIDVSGNKSCIISPPHCTKATAHSPPLFFVCSPLDNAMRTLNDLRAHPDEHTRVVRRETLRVCRRCAKRLSVARRQCPVFLLQQMLAPHPRFLPRTQVCCGHKKSFPFPFRLTCPTFV